MTQAEKYAKELVDRFRDYSHTDFIQNKGGYQMKSQIESAKQCSLICVEELKKQCRSFDYALFISQNQHLEEVKQAINKM